MQHVSDAHAETDVPTLLRRLERERAARKAAEDLLERKSLELYEANEALRGQISDRERAQAELTRVNRELEYRVAERTQDLGKTNARLEKAMTEFLEIDRAQRKERDAAEAAAQLLRDRLRHGIAEARALVESLRSRVDPQSHAALVRLWVHLDGRSEVSEDGTNGGKS